MYKYIFWIFLMALTGMGTDTSFAQEALNSIPENMSTGELNAKRLSPPEVDPVVIGKVRFQVIHWGKERGLPQNGGYISASDLSSGKELWILKVYDITYDPVLEGDVQDNFIVSMSKGFLAENSLSKTKKGAIL